MLTTCPHCFTRVIPKADGTCPACQRNVNDPRGADATRTSLRVSQGDVLPAVCCECGGRRINMSLSAITPPTRSPVS